MTKYLNLDEIVAPEKVLKLAGKEHAMVPLTVEGFITQIKEARSLEAAGDVDVADQVDAMVKMIDRVFPSIGGDELRKLPVSHLNAILEFARQDDEDAAKRAVESAEGKEKN